MFSSDEYRALRAGAGSLERRTRGQLSLTGADRRAFLQGLLTNDIVALGPGTGCYAAMLTANGRMIADMRVFELGDAILLDADAALTGSLTGRFDQSIFSEDVQVQDLSATHRAVGVYGPLASRVVARALATVLPAGWDAARLEVMPVNSSVRAGDGAAGRLELVRSDDIGVDGFDLFVEADGADALRESLRHAGAVHVPEQVAEIARIEAGRPRFGVDMDETTIPLEAGIEDRAISLTKGCYVGQEIIIRVLHRGQGRVARRLVGLTLDSGGAPAAAGASIASGARQLGSVTSAAFSPTLDRAIALGYVHRDFAEPGTPVLVSGAAGAVPATVTALPFVARGGGSA